MKLFHVANKYITFKQSVGMHFQSEARILKSFCRAMGDIDITEVKPASILAFISGNGPVTSFWHGKFTILRGFYRFAITRNYINFSPLPTTIPKRPESFSPYIYTTDELRRLLASTDILASPLNPLRPTTFRTLLLTLYSTGIRISEALYLTLKDVNLLDSLITVRDSKFFKSRLVPIGPILTKTLEIYVSKRRQLPLPAGENSPLFVTRTGNTLCYDIVNDVWQILRKHANIHREDECRYQPRIHDLRHTSAVHRLVAWYREGADVQHMLPLLSTYLGHLNINGTQHYLSIIPELRNEALRRFERYALSEVNHE